MLVGGVSDVESGNESIIQYQDHVEKLPLCTRSDRDTVGVS